MTPVTSTTPVAETVSEPVELAQQVSPVKSTFAQAQPIPQTTVASDDMFVDKNSAEYKAAQMACSIDNPDDCETGDCSDLDPDGDGFRVYGDAEADFNLGWINNITFGNFDFSMVWHLKQGGDGVNLSTLLYDLGNTTWDYDDITLDPEGVTPNGDYRKNTWFAGDAGSWIEDASYLRMREIGVYYNVPESIVNFANLKIGVSGRNLINIFDYNSYDPEVSNFGGNVLANSIEVTPFPSSKRINFHINATF